MSKWEMVRLGTIGDFKSGGTPTRGNPEYFKGNIPWITTISLGKTLIDESDAVEHISAEAVANSSTKIILENSIMVGIRVGVGKVSINTVPMCGSQDIISIENIDEKQIYKQYIVHCIKSYSRFFDTQKRGATIQGINSGVLKSLDIPLPPLETQKQIAKTLDTAAELLAMRKQQIAELDSLIKSVFYDLFGDPVANEKGWETIVLGNCLDRIENGWSPICKDRVVIDKEWGVCKLSAVTGGYYKENENKAIFSDTKIKTGLEVKNGDLLFSRKNTIELVGSCAYVFESTKKLMIPDTIFRFCTKGNIHKLYLWGLLNCQTFKPFIQQLAGGTSGSMPNISKERLKGLEIPRPTFLKQTQFASIVTKIEEQKALVKKAIDETQYLFDSLMSEYFE